VADQDTSAELADPPEVAVKLQLQRPTEHLQVRRGFDPIEAGEPVERLLDAVGGGPLGVGPPLALALAAEVAPQRLPAPGGQPIPRGAPLRVGEQIEQLPDEGSECVRLLGAAALPGDEPVAGFVAGGFDVRP
jgi:hypothetical protein